MSFEVTHLISLMAFDARVTGRVVFAVHCEAACYTVFLEYAYFGFPHCKIFALTLLYRVFEFQLSRFFSIEIHVFKLIYYLYFTIFASVSDYMWSLE